MSEQNTKCNTEKNVVYLTTKNEEGELHIPSRYSYLGLSSSDSDEELSSPSYASFLHGDRKPVYSDVVWKQMVCEKRYNQLITSMGKGKKPELPTGIEPMTFHTLVGRSNH